MLGTVSTVQLYSRCWNSTVKRSKRSREQHFRVYCPVGGKIQINKQKIIISDNDKLCKEGKIGGGNRIESTPDSCIR